MVHIRLKQITVRGMNTCQNSASSNGITSKNDVHLSDLNSDTKCSFRDVSAVVQDFDSLFQNDDLYGVAVN